MADILGSAVGFDEAPTAEALAARMGDMNLRPLFDQDRQVPMLVINGTDDVHIPRADTLVFDGRRDTRVMLVPDTGHCAVSKLAELVPVIIGWIGEQFER